MADFITTDIEWGGKETTDIILSKMWKGENPLMSGIRIIPNVQSKLKLNYFGAKRKVLKAYQSGFNPVTGVAYTQREISVSDFKAEMAQDAYAFTQTVLEQVLGKGVDWNNLEAADKELRDSIIEIFQNAILADIFQKYWLNDTKKETITGGYLTGVTDTDYSDFDGIWALMYANSSTSPSATQIKRIDFNSTTYLDEVAVKNKKTATITGSSGTANLKVNGVNYLLTFDADLTTTAANGASAHLTALAARYLGYTISSSGAGIIVESVVPGNPLDITVTNLTGNLAGTVADTTPNVVMGAIKAGGAKAALKAAFVGADPILKGIAKKDKIFYVTDSVYENLQESYESDGTEAAHTKLVDGVETLTFRGIPVKPMGWNVLLDADSIEQYTYPHRILYTQANDLVLATDATSDFTKSEFWYEKKDQQNCFRVQCKLGANFEDVQRITVVY